MSEKLKLKLRKLLEDLEWPVTTWLARNVSNGVAREFFFYLLQYRFEVTVAWSPSVPFFFLHPYGSWSGRGWKYCWSATLLGASVVIEARHEKFSEALDELDQWKRSKDASCP